MPDLCILDVMMPGMDGLTVCTRIRQKSHVPIIIVSAKDSPWTGSPGSPWEVTIIW